MKTGLLYDELFRKYQEQEIFDKALDMVPRISEWFAGAKLKNKKVLDIGCGAGKYSLAFEALGAKVISLDLHEAAKGIVKRHVLGDALNLPFKDNTFDITFSSGVAHHTGDTMAALSEQKRVTKRGGLVYVAVYRNIPYYWAVYALRAVKPALSKKWLEKRMGFDVDNIYVEHIETFTNAEIEKLFFSKNLIIENHLIGKYMHRIIARKK